MILSSETLALMCGGVASQQNVKSFCAGLNRAGVGFGLNQPHRLAHYLAQMMHESARFKYDREIWGPTPAQKRYDTRTDLGNTPEKDGDGKKFSGRTAIQITGKSNYRQFTTWCRGFDTKAPDFVKNPDAANTDPWEGLGPIWYWDTRNLNRYADENALETVTRKINGGTNGLADRYVCYRRAALVLLGFHPNDVRGFQEHAGLTIDGLVGKNTRAAMHDKLVALPEVEGPRGGGFNFRAVFAVILRIIFNLFKRKI